MTHACNLKSAWPIGHPLPAEDPAKLTGPELGTVWPYEGQYGGAGQTATVISRSYVWSPGECRSQGGYRHYDWSVVLVTVPAGSDERHPNGRTYTVVVNDSTLED